MGNMRNETIVDRVVERLKLQPIGDLITEEDLHDIVKMAIPKTFFEPRRIQEGSGYNARTIDKEPLLIEIMRDLLTPVIREQVQEFMSENRETTLEFWKDVLSQGVKQYVEKLQREAATAHIRDALRPMLDELNRERSARGQMMIHI